MLSGSKTLIGVVTLQKCEVLVLKEVQNWQHIDGIANFHLALFRRQILLGHSCDEILWDKYHNIIDCRFLNKHYNYHGCRSPKLDLITLFGGDCLDTPADLVLGKSIGFADSPIFDLINYIYCCLIVLRSFNSDSSFRSGFIF